MDEFLEWLRSPPIPGVNVTAGALLVAILVLVAAWAFGHAAVWLLRRVTRRLSSQDDQGTQPLARLLRVVILLMGLHLALTVVGLHPRALLDNHLVTFGGNDVTVLTVAIALGMIAGAYVLSRLMQITIRRRSADAPMQSRATLATVSKLGHYAIMLIGVSLALSNLGVNLTAVFAVGGVVMIALGFAMQTIAQNFISGVILLVERAIKIEDILEVEGTVVRVRSMGIRTTIVRTRDGEELIVPNSTLVQSTVKNFTYRDSDYRVRVNVGVTYGSDMKQVFEVLTATVRGLDWTLKDPAPRVLMTGFGSSSVDFEVDVWMEDPWLARTRRSELHNVIWWALKEAEVTIAFPQLDIHFDPPVQQALVDRASAA